VIRLLLVAMVVATVGAMAADGARQTGEVPAPIRMDPIEAIGVRLDTSMVGGFASGTFRDAMDGLGSELTPEERALLGEHLTGIFADAVPEGSLGSAGRLRVAYERALRPDGSTRSIRVLGAEAAVAGRVHTAFYFERDGRPGYYDSFGHALRGADWGGPLPDLRVTSSFGEHRRHPILNRVLPHTGVDLAARVGDPVHATADGIVTIARVQGGYGLLIELRHPNGYSTRYAHLSGFAPGIEPARLARRGDVIGYVGMSGLATGPHLHYEVRRRGQVVDPLRATAAAWTSGIGADPRWAEDRRLLGGVLARVPTVAATTIPHPPTVP
jgi:hypothetical protein